MSDPENSAGTVRGRFIKGISGNPGGRPAAEREVRELARKYTTRAIRRLAALMKSSNERVAVAATIALLDRAWGRPAQALTGPDGAPLIPAGFGATAIIGVDDPAEIYRRMLRDTTQRVTFAEDSQPAAEQPTTQQPPSERIQ